MLTSLKKWAYKKFILPRIERTNLQKVKDKTKIFVIGRNKTGTTSLHHEFLERGFIVGNQRKAELLLDNYLDKDFESIISYCKTAQVFQDIPFSYPETYKHLHKAFPDAKFILTLRDSPEQWYNSITKFHSKIFGNGKIPTKKDLQNANYVYKGWIWKANRFMYNTPENDPYQKDKLIQSYIDYNDSVLEYFKDKNNLLVINLSEKDAYTKFCNFLNLPLEGKNSFPWKNKTSEIKRK